MNRVKWNALIDGLAFLGLIVMTSTGLVLRYVLPHGSGGLGGGYGWRASQRPVSLLWDMTRQEWGEIHFWSAILMLAVLAVHLALHWRWIVCVIRGQPTAPASGMRLALAFFALLALLAIAAAPFLTPTEQVPRADLQERRNAAIGIP